MSRDQEIVITGVGAVCSAGSEPAEIAEAVFSGRSALAEITAWNTDGWPASKGGQASLKPRDLVEDRKLHKFITRSDMLGLYAAKRALESSGVLTHRDSLGQGRDQFNDRSGVYVGSGGGAYQNSYDFLPVLEEIKNDPSQFGAIMEQTVSPMWLLRNLPNNVVCHTGIRHELKGSNACVTNQCVGGVQALGEAAAIIRQNEADRSVVVGHDNPVEPETVLYYDRLGLMATEEIRPFDARRAGTILGEAAAAVMLERRGDALSRGAEILGAVLASASTTEAEGIVKIRTDGDGVARAIFAALAQAGLEPKDIGIVIAHGNGTKTSDASEALGYLRVFGSEIPPVTAFKWCYGHGIAASGLLDVTIALQTLKRRAVPGIPTLSSIDPALSFLPASAAPQELRSDVALLLCRGFGGTNTVTILRAS